ncbi:MAG: hypothetical protein QM728_10495 [Gordonia sp. (in: high G+C Gram-positive bacteria)]|uniref:DUF6542 domain-containing protein n=1 Tax=Gordonia sp. (in: high G+C Gram-positive bacteria) TaxID=84139 RepID=UPI0039E3F10E
MRFLQAQSDVPLAEQSVAANRRGVPWWGAVLIAFGFSLAGIALDSIAARLFGIGDGLHARQVLFAVGCLIAALAVCNKALFTAAVQPPLVAIGLVFARVIGVKIKGLFTSAHVPELNSLLIKQIFTFSNDFPVILFTFLAVLTVVLVRLRRLRKARQELAAKAKEKKAAAKKAAVKPAPGRPHQPAQQPRPARPESAAVRASRAAAQAEAAAQRRRPGQPAASATRAAPTVVPSGGLNRRPAGAAQAQGQPRRPAAGPAARNVRPERGPAQPAVRPARKTTPPPQAGRRRAAPPPLDDDGF